MIFALKIFFSIFFFRGGWGKCLLLCSQSPAHVYVHAPGLRAPNVWIRVSVVRADTGIRVHDNDTPARQTMEVGLFCRFA